MQVYTFAAGGKNVSVFASAEAGAPVIYLNAAPDEGMRVLEAAEGAGCGPFTLVSVGGLDWNRDMALWDAPAVFRGAEPFSGGADDYLRILTGEILPTAEGYLGAAPRWRGIAGYSLAGLFCVYSVYRTDMFSRVASMSGSLWYPGFWEYIHSHEPKQIPDHIYFSLGDREDRTRNPVLRNVRRDTEAIMEFYRDVGVDTTFELNPGNHFVQGSERTVAGIQWLLNR